MGLPRSTYYDAPSVGADDAEILTRMRAICDEVETYGYRRVGAAFRHPEIVQRQEARQRRAFLGGGHHLYRVRSANALARNDLASDPAESPGACSRGSVVRLCGKPHEAVNEQRPSLRRVR